MVEEVLHFTPDSVSNDDVSVREGLACVSSCLSPLLSATFSSLPQPQIVASKSVRDKRCLTLFGI